MPPISIRFGGYQSPASVHHKAAERFGHALTAQLGDSVDFRLDGNIIDSGHQAADLLGMVESGVLTCCYFSASYLAARVPAFALLDLPFLINDRPTAYHVLDGPLGNHLADRLAADTGFHLLGWWDNGFRHLSNRVRPIRTPADCQGLRLRTLMSDMHQRVFQMLGFEPVALDVKELMSEVKAATIDAQENPLTNFYNFGFYDHHPHLTLSGHFFGAAILLCHQESYRSWPSDVQDAVQAAANAATRQQRQDAGAEDREVMAKLNPNQTAIVHLTDAERLAFVNAIAPLVAEQRRVFGDQLFRLLP